jgi:hypothetical protein
MFVNRKKPVEAKRVGSTLVAIFRASKPELIWKFDLERNHSFTLALQGDEGDLELGVTSPKGEFYPIARFAAREDADEAFLAVQKVLMKGKCSRAACLLKWAGGLVLLLLIATFVAALMVGRGLGVGQVWSSSAPVIQNGVPLPADQVLQPPP